MALSRAPGPWNRVALYSVESPGQTLALDPDLAGCERPHMCTRVLAMSPGMPSRQLAVTEASMKFWGSAVPAARVVGFCCWRTRMCLLTPHSGTWGDLARVADHQLVDAQWNGWVRDTAGLRPLTLPAAIVLCSSVLTSARVSALWFCALLPVWQS